jgi:predicted phosphohydrolase
VKYKNTERGQVVVSVPANAGDIFWSMDLPDKKDRTKFIKDGIDRLVSPNGKTGRILNLIDSGFPVVIVTHWQSLYTQGTELGLEGLIALVERIQKVFGSDFEWIKCSEMAKRYAEIQT